MEYILLTVFPEQETEKGGPVSEYVRKNYLMYDKIIAITEKKNSTIFFPVDEKWSIEEWSIEECEEEGTISSMSIIISDNLEKTCMYDVCGYGCDDDLVKCCYLLEKEEYRFRILASLSFTRIEKYKPILPFLLMSSFRNRVVM